MNTPIKFPERMQVLPHRSKTQPVPEKYLKYKYKTVEEYKERKSYPSKEKDLRPDKMRIYDLCMHGTNYSSILSAIRKTNKQLVPAWKLIKLTGKHSDTGENQGLTPLNSKSVSTFPLMHWETGEFKLPNLAIDFAKSAASSFVRKSSNLKAEDNIPVVVIGDGAGKRKKINLKEVAYSRVNIRILAAPDFETAQKIKNDLQEMKVKDISVCTFDDLEKAQDLIDKVNQKLLPLMTSVEPSEEITPLTIDQLKKLYDSKTPRELTQALSELLYEENSKSQSESKFNYDFSLVGRSLLKNIVREKALFTKEEMDEDLSLFFGIEYRVGHIISTINYLKGVVSLVNEEFAHSLVDEPKKNNSSESTIPGP